MPYTYTLTSMIPASAQEIYDAWLDSLVHSEMTGGEATMSGEIGAEVSAWDGYISGRNLELVPGERIVQSWRTTEFSDEHGDSIITVTFEEADDGTLLTLVHSNVPDEQRSYEEGGWESKYFEPMKAYFGSLERAAVESPPERAAPEVAAGKQAKKTKKAKRAAPRGKAASGENKTKRVVAAKAKGKSAKPGARKAAGRTATKSSSGGRKRTRR
jgi:uncharacterized protein YndB with AHSA1/START domain